MFGESVVAPSIPCSDSSTICARRQVTTDADLGRTIRSSRFPSSFETARPRKPSRDTGNSDPTPTSAK